MPNFQGLWPIEANICQNFKGIWAIKATVYPISQGNWAINATVCQIYQVTLVTSYRVIGVVDSFGIEVAIEMVLGVMLLTLDQVSSTIAST